MEVADLETSAWVNGDEGRTRTERFHQPTKTPMGNKVAHVVETQTLVRENPLYAPLGMCVPC